MKIALASDDGKNISRHFGRTAGFVIVELEKGKEIGREYRKNTFTGHARGMHAGPRNGDGHSHAHGGGHSHAGILGALGDCEAVISMGMGRRLYDDLASAGKKVFVTTEPSVDKAVELYAAQTLDDNPDKSCEH